jgi:hypothetical protein
MGHAGDRRDVSSRRSAGVRVPHRMQRANCEHVEDECGDGAGELHDRHQEVP